MLDDYHLLTDPAIHESVEFLLAYLPPALHLVIAARADPPLPLARMRARGDADRDPGRRPAVHAGGGSGARGRRRGDRGGGDRRARRAHRGLAGRAAAGGADAAGRRRPGRRGRDDPRRRAAHPRLLRRRGAGRARRRPARPAGPRARCWSGSPGRCATPCWARPVRPRSWTGSTAPTCSSPPVGDRWYRCHRLFRDVLRVELDATAPDAAAGAAGPRGRLVPRARDASSRPSSTGWRPGDAAGARRPAARATSAGSSTTARWPRCCGWARAWPLRCSDAHLYLMLAFAAGLSGQAGRSVEWLAAAEPLIEADADAVPRLEQPARRRRHHLGHLRHAGRSRGRAAVRAAGRGAGGRSGAVGARRRAQQPGRARCSAPGACTRPPTC